MRRYLLTAVISGLLCAGWSYFLYRADFDRFMQAYEPAASETLRTKERSMYNCYDMENWLNRAKKVNRLYVQGHDLAYALWLNEHLLNCSLFGLIAGPLLLYSWDRTKRGFAIR